jgi:hypothetical protein
MALRGVQYPFPLPLLGTVSNKLSFKCQSFPDLLASPDLNNNKIYILKQQSLVPTTLLVVLKWLSGKEVSKSG